MRNIVYGFILIYNIIFIKIKFLLCVLKFEESYWIFCQLLINICQKLFFVFFVWGSYCFFQYIFKCCCLEVKEKQIYESGFVVGRVVVYYCIGK